MRTLLFLALAGAAWAQKPLDIYWIDTEGGAATLIVSPTGESLLADTGNAGQRDARRIVAVAMRQAHLAKIDILVTTHFHSDHVGGVEELLKLMPIGKFIDHGDAMEIEQPSDAKLWQTYKALAGRDRTSLGVGDTIPLSGVKIQVVTSNGNVLSTGGDANPLCAGAAKKEVDPGENARSLGFKLTYGKFTFLDLGDLTWNKELELACPQNHLGRVTMFQATHHGFFGDRSGAPALVWALRPQVVIVNNGPQKGLGTDAYDTIAKIPGLEDAWQVHTSLANDAAHNTAPDKIANAEPTGQCKGNFLKASISAGGKFTVTNSRNGYSKTYTTR